MVSKQGLGQVFGATSANPDYTALDFPLSPLVVFYEVTRACNLLCRHCRAEAQPHSHPLELDTRTSLSLIDDLVKFPKPPLLVLTGGDPIKRRDVFDIVHHAVASGLKTAMTPSATKLANTRAVVQLKQAGLHRLAVSLDGADADTHDGFRRVPGSYQRTLEIIADAAACGLPLQINTTIARHNFHQIDAIADVLAAFPIVLWSVFFLVPTGRALADQRITADEFEVAFEKLFRQSGRQKYAIKTTEAPHYRRFMMEKMKRRGTSSDSLRLPNIVGTNDGRGVMFISHIGEIFPSGFLPVECGRFPRDSVVHTYQHSPLFVDLRDPAKLKGKCGVCHYRDICGGSRARAFGLTGDPLAAEPDCAYGSMQDQQQLPTRSLPVCSV
jgi:radical SAM protein